MGKGWVIRFISGKIQIQVDECRHQIGLSRPHGETEQVVCIGHPIEGLLEEYFIINTLRVFADLLFQHFGNLFPAVIF